MKLQKLWEEIKVTQDMVQQLGGSRPDVQEVDEALPDTISSFDEMDEFNDRLLDIRVFLGKAGCYLANIKKIFYLICT